jgi:hypothetical protein
MVDYEKAVEQAKNYYNRLLDRHYKALIFFADNEITIEDKEKWVPEYREILASLGEMLDIIGEYTDENILNGFEVYTKDEARRV